jgi:ribonucleoside-diphosphate reductase alpha chain
MMTQTTSGIEPAFAVSYTRRRKINPEDKDVKVVHVDDVGDKFTEYKIFHHAYKQWMDVTGNTDADYEKSPYFKATANDVDWRASVDIQAAAQRWVCHSISKTCNLPADATRDLVSDVYMDAWEKGCKGFTVYRDGCRDGILITENSAKPAVEPTSIFSEVDAPKRPESLECEVSHIKINGQPWVIFTGLLEGRPYEVFGGIAENIQLPKKIKHGVISKTGKKDGRGIYSFSAGEGEDKIVVKDVVKAFANVNYAFHTLAISGLLRTGMGVQYVLDIINKADEDAELFSFNKVISRVLKHHIKDGTKAGEKCPSCGAEMHFSEGCKSCTCGYSKCG